MASGCPAAAGIQFFHPPFPSVGVAKVTLYFQSPNFGATFFSFLPACWNPRRCSHSRPISARRYSLKAGAKVCVYPIQSKYMPKFFSIKLRTVATVALFSAQWGVKKIQKQHRTWQCMEDAESQNIQRIAQSKVQRTLTPPPQTHRHSIALAHYIRITSLTKIDLIFLQKSLFIRYNDISFKLHLYHKVEKLSCGVIGNTSDSGSEEFRFET